MRLRGSFGTAVLVLAAVQSLAVAPRGQAPDKPAAPAIEPKAEPAGEPPGGPAGEPYPQLITAATRADEDALAALQRPGKVLFTDGFESEASFAAYFEIGGQKEGRVRIATAPGDVHTGKGALHLTAPDCDGKSAGAGCVLWLGDEGHERVHLRYYQRWAEDYDQGNLNHTGGALVAVAGVNKWRGMGTAGQRPKGDDHFSSSIEGWCDWRRVELPGFLFSYAYWMDMRRDRDGHWWGNMLGPEPGERIVPRRGRWTCIEQMVRVNTVGAADGELAVWVDGALYLHYRGFRWRSSDEVRIKRAWLSIYVHEARRDNTVGYDDVVVSTGYVGPVAPVAPVAPEQATGR